MSDEKWKEIEDALWQVCKIVCLIAFITILTTGCAAVRSFFEDKVYDTPVWWEQHRFPIQRCCALPPPQLERDDAIEVSPQHGGRIV